MSYTKFACLLFAFACCISCGKDEEDNDTNSKEIYLRYKVDGVQKDFTSTTAFWGSNGGNIWAYLDGTSSILEFEWDNSSQVTGADILALEGKQFSFNDTDSIYANFSLEVNTINAMSGVTGNPYPVNFVKVTSVEEDTRFPNIVPEKMYLVQGTFKCEVDDGGSEHYSITDGEFSLIFQEE